MAAGEIDDTSPPTPHAANGLDAADDDGDGGGAGLGGNGSVHLIRRHLGLQNESKNQLS